MARSSRLHSLSPEPLVVVRVHGEMNCETPKQFNHDEHTLSILLKGEGTYRNASLEFRDYVGGLIREGDAA